MHLVNLLARELFCTSTFLKGKQGHESLLGRNPTATETVLGIWIVGFE